GEAITESKQKYKDKIVNHYWKDLQMFLNLRNVLSHEQDRNDILANPTDETVKRIVAIKDKIINPDVVGKLFKTKVVSFKSDNSLDKVLNVVKDYDFTQFPIFSNEEFIGVLSENGITRWLSRKVEDDVLSIKETKVEEVLDLEESKDNFGFINPSANVFDLLNKFQKGYRNHNKSLILLVTGKKDPKKSSDFTGIITYADLQKIYNHI
ncbi:MAG: CBS domain-containing protein, partial [bacterium]